jgi:DNA-directed RNA polymerase subunit H (RpoH/RPB5)
MDCAYTNFGRTVENFTLDELMINLHHDNVPKHELITTEEAKALLTGLKLPHLLSYILDHRWPDTSEPDQATSSRSSLTAGETIFYRFCV